ncbi:hypothetical protein GCM10010415_36460 [Streptomyces atrovirens]
MTGDISTLPPGGHQWRNATNSPNLHDGTYTHSRPSRPRMVSSSRFDCDPERAERGPASPMAIRPPVCLRKRPLPEAFRHPPRVAPFAPLRQDCLPSCG